MDGNADFLNRFPPGEHHGVQFKRCRRCGVQKALWAFYRERTCRGGHRPECKRCHAAWRRSHYQPKTGKRYVTKADKARARVTKPAGIITQA